MKGFSEIFKRIASKHGIKTAFRPGTKVKELKSTARTPLGDKKANVVYTIPVNVKIMFMWEKLIECSKLGRQNIRPKFV